MISDTEVGGFVFEPSLQDISLKRFRLRYSTVSDCYYLHWDNTVCPQLARIQGLENGVEEISGIQRVEEEEKGKAFLTSCNSEDKVNSTVLSLAGGKIQWSVDFSGCGLAVKSASIRAVMEEKKGVRVSVAGNNSESHHIDSFPNGDYAEVKWLYGSRKLTLTAYLPAPSDPALFLSTDLDDSSFCPLDIKLNLMCYRPDNWVYSGEILLGMKFSETGAAESLKKREDIAVDCGLMGGQLQVHVVEGAGLVKGSSGKPYNASVRCQLLPDPTNSMSRQTAPKHSGYPTWTKEFIFAGIDKADVQNGGLEVTICDHHTIRSDTVMSGVRLCVPQHTPLIDRAVSPYPFSPCSSRSVSPDLTLSPSHPSNPFSPSPSPSPTPSPAVSYNDLTDIGRTSHCPAHLTDSLLYPCEYPGSPLRTTFKRASMPHTLSCHMNSPSGVRKVPIFTLPRGRNSPAPSPILSRKNKSPRSSPSRLSKCKLSNGSNSSSGLMHDWMDAEGCELSHWKSVVDSPGNWVYCWHLLRQDFTPAHHRD